MLNLEDLTHFDDADDVGAEADINNLESIISVSPIPTTRIHKDHPTTQIIGDLSSTTQTRSMARTVRDQGGISMMFNEDFHTFQNAESLDLSSSTLWKEEKKDERGIVIRNKARLVAQGHTSEEAIDYEECISLWHYRRGSIRMSIEDLENPDKVYKVVKALYGLHQAPRAWSLGKSASTPIDAEKPLLKDSDGEDVDVHTYSDYAGASLDRKSTTEGCQFLGCRLISWQCKKQTVVATSSTEAEYVAAASGCAQVLWTQNQLLHYGNVVIEIAVLNILSDALPITTNGIQ
nr:uncharacterized mitochondrial protein AtMg00810-like [Tanacetum cinerariifolium]